MIPVRALALPSILLFLQIFVMLFLYSGPPKAQELLPTVAFVFASAELAALLNAVFTNGEDDDESEKEGDE